MTRERGNNQRATGDGWRERDGRQLLRLEMSVVTQRLCKYFEAAVPCDNGIRQLQDISHLLSCRTGRPTGLESVYNKTFVGENRQLVIIRELSTCHHRRYDNQTYILILNYSRQLRCFRLGSYLTSYISGLCFYIPTYYVGTWVPGVNT